MKRNTNRARRSITYLLLGCAPLAAAGCTSELVGQIATLTGSYFGDVVTVLATGYLEQAWSVEADHAHEEEDGHSHSDEPLHDHEH
jgi:hypothetical protein